MCGRFYADEKLVNDIWNIIQDVDRRLRIPVVGDVRPDDKALAIYGEHYNLTAGSMKWGFRSLTGSGILINARAESVMDKITFSNSIWHRCCVIPTNWFYEWNKNKEKVIFKRKEHPMLYMAGCYQRYEEGNRFLILTTKANNSMEPIHDRMPIILEQDELEDWVFDDEFMRHVLRRIPVDLTREQEYEQQSFSF